MTGGYVGSPDAGIQPHPMRDRDMPLALSGAGVGYRGMLGERSDERWTVAWCISPPADSTRVTRHRLPDATLAVLSAVPVLLSSLVRSSRSLWALRSGLPAKEQFAPLHPASQEGRDDSAGCRAGDHRYVCPSPLEAIRCPAGGGDSCRSCREHSLRKTLPI